MPAVAPLLLALILSLWPAPSAPVVTPPPPPELVDEAEITILMYHHLETDETKIKQPTLVVTPERFDEQLAWFTTNGYTPMHLSAVEAHLLQNKPLPAKTLVITFDDGYRSNYELAYPVLKKYQAPATIFVIGARIGVEQEAGRPEFLSWEQAGEMVASGLVAIHSHTYDLHHYPTGAKQPAAVVGSQAQVLADFAAARKQLEGRLGYTSNYIAFPYGWYTAREEGLAKQAGFTLALSIEEGVNTKASNPLRLRRFTISHEDTPERLQERFGK